MKETGLYAGLLQRVWPGVRLGLATYILGVAAYYGLGCWTGMNARYGRSFGDLGDDLWTPQQCIYAAGITFTTIGYTDLLGTDDVKVYRHPRTGRFYAWNSADRLVPEPGAAPASIDDLELIHDYSLLTTMGTVVIALVGMGVFVYSISAVTAFFVEGGHLELQRARRVRAEAAALRGHVVVAGAGETGAFAAARFVAEGIRIVVIDRDRAAVARLEAEHPDVLAMVGDATEEEDLQATGIARAMGIVLALPDDNDNLVGIVTARQENHGIRILTRARDQAGTGRLLRAGAHEAVAPSFMGGMRLASEAIRPTVVRFLDAFLGHEDDATGYRFTGVKVEAGSPHAGRTLGESGVEEATGIRVLALRYAGKKDFRYNPGPQAALEAGTEVAVLADPEGVRRIREHFAGGRPA